MGGSTKETTTDIASLRHKVGKKLKLSTGKSKRYKEDDKKSQFDIEDSKSYKKDSDGKKVTKARKKDKNLGEGQEDREGRAHGKHKPLSSDGKRKRIYAEKDMDIVGNMYDTEETYKEKNIHKKGHNRVKDELGRVKSPDKSRSMWVSGKSNNGASKIKNGSHNKDAVKLSEVLSKKWTGKVKQSDEVDNGRSTTSKKHVKSKVISDKNASTTQYKFSEVSTSKSLKNTGRDKKGLDDSNIIDEKPKKKKRVIWKEPYDISNKRIDDGLVTDVSAKEKKVEVEKDAKMSKNAEFRAIKPSPSILSFVEDNLLGRRRPIEIRRAGYNIELSAPLDNIPLSTSEERERIEENIFRNKLEFFAAAKVSSSFPPPNLPEIAFAGRSNVGKSSLLNALTRQWGVVRTSDKPGLTQTINFFKLGTKLSLVDLPGYGFAYAKEEVKDAWEELVKEYVATRVGLKRVCLLIDTKWGMKPRDQELINLMERSQTKYQIVLTKTDTVFPMDVARRAMQIEESLKANKSIIEPVMMVSSKSGAGIRSLRTVLAKIARFAKI